MQKIVLLLVISFTPFILSAQDVLLPYKNDKLSVEERVTDLLSRMTLKEKIGQMTQLNITLINTTGEQRDVVLDPDKARTYIKEHHIGSFLNGESVPARQWYEYINELQHIAVEESRLGIPIIYGIDHMHGASYLHDATVFPHNINMAATFSPQHAFNNGEITAIESADLGHHWNFAPVLDLGRNPYWARFYETFGESPFVAATLGASYVKGLQNYEATHPYKVASTGKHFLGYSDPKSGWDRTPVDLSDQTIFEFHVPSFQAAIDAGLKTIMLNSSEINGIPVHGSKHIVGDILRDKMNFDGVVITDWDDIRKMVNYHYVAKDFTEATLMAIEAGIDMSMTPLTLDFNQSLLELADKGLVSENRIDQSVARILKLKFELGLFEYPYPSDDRLNRIGSETNRAKALKAAEESLVLLKNDEGILPLSPEIDKIVVVGPSADSKRNLSGGWTIAWQGGENERFPESVHTIYSALKAKYSDKEIVLVQSSNIAELNSAAKDAGLIIAAIGEEPYTEFVGNITDLRLPEDQRNLIRAASDTGTPVVGVYVGGRPRIVDDILDHLNAYLYAGLPGFFGAQAIVNVLSGEVNPSGKLPFSYPVYTGHFVPHNHKPSDVYFFNPEEANNIEQGEKMVWQWPFGYGLSYTQFNYSDIQLSDSLIHQNGSLKAEITVTNSGEVKGIETVIWFMKDEVASVTRPVRQVRHFERIELEPGESKTVSFNISPSRDLTFPDQNGRKLLEEGYFTIMTKDKRARFFLSKAQVAASDE